jgi:hypothetical protein
MRQRIIAALLRLYPAAWRLEYGPELRGVLEDRPLGARTVANVVRGGLWQRLRSAEPWMVMGLPLMVFGFAGMTRQIVAPPAYAPGVEDPGSWPGAIIGLLILMGCGCWTVLRHDGTLPRAGVQVVKMGLLFDVPFFLVALLMGTGVLDVIVLGPGDSPTTFAEHGFAITAYGRDGVAAFVYTPLGLLLTHLGGLVDCWIFGALGGAVGRAIRRRPMPSIPAP